MLRLSGEVRLSGPKNSKNLGSGSPQRRDLHLGEAPRLGVRVSG